MPYTFSRTVMSLVDSEREPYILLSLVKDLYKYRIANKKNPDQYYREQINETEQEIQSLRSTLGYNNRGQIFGGSKILRNMLKVASSECPGLTSPEGWGGFDVRVLFPIFDNPLLINDTCQGNQKIKNIVAAYLYLSFVGQASEYPDTKPDVKLLDNANLLFPDDKWIVEARSKYSDIESLEAQLKETREENNCFIATATYGTELAEEVIILKLFRDQYLERVAIGRIFVSTYYKISPYFARKIAASACLKMIMKYIILRPFVTLIKLTIHDKRF